ncbi:MAG: FCD domain-containing protein [Pirellulales bacterium]
MPKSRPAAKSRPSKSPADRTAEITAYLENLILCGELKADDRLPPERLLAEEWRVSRSVVREAIGRLAGLGLVHSRQGSGTRIVAADGSRQRLNYQWMLSQGVLRLDQLSDARLPLETTIAAMAAEHRKDEHLRQLEAAQQALGNPKQSLKAHVDADVRFHAVLAEATGNPIFQVILQPIQELLIEGRRRTLGRYGTKLAHEHHAKILTAVKRRDVEGAPRRCGFTSWRTRRIWRSLSPRESAKRKSFCGAWRRAALRNSSGETA